MDYTTLFYDPIYKGLSVPATINGVAIRVIDKTRAKPQVTNGVEVRSVGPAATARIPELTKKGITRDDYEGATLTFNGRTWTVLSHELTGSPNGEDLGEVLFVLMANP
jgi:hypothetical protein